MVGPLVAAAGRAAAKSAAKTTAKRAATSAAKSTAGKAAARAPKAGDVATNARKRYYRASERYLKKAEETSGVTSARYRQMAKQNFEDALGTYDSNNTQRLSKPMQKLANEFGYDVSGKTKKVTDETELNRLKLRRSYVIGESENVLEGSLKDESVRRQREAQTVFRSTELGRRILGGYVEVWKDYATELDEATGELKVNNKKIFEALFKYFDVDNLADLVEKVENDIGETLYEMNNPDEIYEVVKLTIQNKVLDNSTIQ